MCYFWSDLHHCSRRLIFHSYENIPNINNLIAVIVCLSHCPCVSGLCGWTTQVRIWEIPEGGLRHNMMEAVLELYGHSRRVGLIEWHPTSSGILFSAGYDYKVSVTPRYPITIELWCILLMGVYFNHYLKSVAHAAKASNQIISFRAPSPT